MEGRERGRRDGEIWYLKRAHKLKKCVTREYLARRWPFASKDKNPHMALAMLVR